MKVLHLNRQNNMGDCMCQMRAMRDLKNQHPDWQIDFMTNQYLHWIVAKHTDIFDTIIFNPDAVSYTSSGYDRVIEFTVDWGQAVNYGILRSWCMTTLGFEPSDDRPYFLLTDEEKLTALIHYRQIMYHDYASYDNNVARYRKSVIFQPEAVSDGRRSFRTEDWKRVIDLFPSDVAIIYFCPILRQLESVVHGPVSDRPNFIMLPGYPIGTSAAMMQLADCIFTVHSGTVMLAHAVDAKNIVHINFQEMSGPRILNVCSGEDVLFPSNQTINWDVIQQKIIQYLG